MTHSAAVDCSEVETELIELAKYLMAFVLSSMECPEDLAMMVEDFAKEESPVVVDQVVQTSESNFEPA